MESQSSGEERAFGADSLETSIASNCVQAVELPLQAFQEFGQKETASRLSDFWANVQLAQLQTRARLPVFFASYLAFKLHVASEIRQFRVDC